MIRFTCGLCGTLLRAPEELAGQKGRCARCGEVNQVPAPLAVDVTRAAPPSPFRSTADLETRGPLEGTVMVEGAHFATAPAALPVEGTDEICEQILLRFSEVGEENEMEAADSQVAGPPITRFPLEPQAQELRGVHPYPDYPSEVDLRNAGVKRALLWALMVGAAIGFFLGLAASKWMF